MFANPIGGGDGVGRARPAMVAGLRLLGLPMAALAARGLVLLLLCATPSSTIEFLSMYSENDAGLSLTPPKNPTAPWGSPPWLNQPSPIAIEQLNHWIGTNDYSTCTKEGCGKPLPSHGYRYQVPPPTTANKFKIIP